MDFIFNTISDILFNLFETKIALMCLKCDFLLTILKQIIILEMGDRKCVIILSEYKVLKISFI